MCYPTSGPSLGTARRPTLTPGAPLLDGDLDTLSDRACALFADARPAWPRAVFHGPDVQMAAAGIDALERGEFSVVVGDFHPGGAPVGQSVFLEGHPDPDSVRRFMAAHLPEPRLIVVPSRTMGRIGGRFTVGYGTTRDRYLLTTDETCTSSGKRCFDIAEIWVDDRDDQAMLVTSEGVVVAPLTHAFEHLMFVSGIRAYQPFAPRRTRLGSPRDALCCAGRRGPFGPRT